MNVHYDHSTNCHTLAGAEAALPYIFGDRCPASLIDVGCGVGTWVRATMDFGITDVCGIDGVDVREDDLLFPRSLFRQQDLTQPWHLGRMFDVALCLEVGEHLPPEKAPTLVQALAVHSDVVMFSGACPGQRGQHHVNCQWPDYWQSLFNAQGYVCDDAIRWKIWDIAAIEPWYRQNMFVATRAPDRAGREPRMSRVIHPQMLAIGAFDVFEDERRRYLALIEAGNQRATWYLTTPFKACAAKLKRLFSQTAGP